MRALWVWVIGLIWATTLAAHEIRPAIGDLEVTDGQLSLVITLNGEALASGVNLDGLQNTDALAESDAVDALRALKPEALRQQLETLAPAFVQSLKLTADDGQPVSAEVTEIAVDPVGNTALPRDTVLTIRGNVPLSAAALELDWPAEYGALVLRQQGVADPYTQYLEGGQGSGPITLSGGDAVSGLQAFATYIPVGFDHILPKGLDHILFVLGLFFLSTRLAPLFWQVTSFTLAHTVTLAMAVLGVVTVPAHIVEPIIAASIVYVAVENILSDRLSRWRPIVVFGFGLLHGLGFASVLGAFGLPDGQVIPALIGFNIGVELGQLTVIAIAFALVWYALKVDEGEAETTRAQVLYGVLAVGFGALGLLANGDGFQSVMGASAMVFFWPLAALSILCALSATLVDQLDAYRRFVAIPASAAIALVGAYWFVERVFF